MPLDLDKIENDIEYVQSLCMLCCDTALDEAILRICNAARLGAAVEEMPVDERLIHALDGTWRTWKWDFRHEPKPYATALAALQAAKEK